MSASAKKGHLLNSALFARRPNAETGRGFRDASQCGTTGSRRDHVDVARLGPKYDLAAGVAAFKSRVGALDLVERNNFGDRHFQLSGSDHCRELG